MKYSLPGLAAALCALALAGCGSSDDHHTLGDGGGGTTAAACPGGTPDSALGSAAGLIAYTTQLVGASSDTSEPAATCNATLPTDDTAEPSA